MRVKKIIIEDKTITLEDVVSIARWTHPINANTHGHTPLTSASGKIINFRRISAENIVTK